MNKSEFIKKWLPLDLKFGGDKREQEFESDLDQLLNSEAGPHLKEFNKGAKLQNASNISKCKIIDRSDYVSFNDGLDD